MGEASRHGTFSERKAKAIERNKEKMATALESLEKKEADLSQEERREQSHARMAMLSFMAFAKRSGLSMKEVRRRIKRHSKKSA